MKDERIVDATGLVKRKLSIYAMILATITLILKLLVNESCILIDAMPEIVLLIGLLFTHLKKPSDEIIDERVIKDINKHYNNAFKWILSLTLISYIISPILLIKTNAVIDVSANFFINGFILLIIIGLTILVRRHNVYLNSKILEDKLYFLKVFKVIGYGFLIAVGSSLIMVFLNYNLPGPIASDFTFVFIFVISFINLSVFYFFYSIFEYIHYKESLTLAEGKTFIVSKNMFLYFGVIVL